ncbi:circadian clock protein KaiB [Roseomonas frigidaquae]|uniref:Circadian clock protein KaiB n=1 Tax=Falsiroseomonas frigidaquae TaxID=487318 RepID=A0ABX1F866_9PROT|nr:circadian clock KaiB family protein [Falsiroseomonas frigidaquae]NKE48419.1 circadian clock protein KaiB [Falsiroseomonas frigidaquae]
MAEAMPHLRLYVAGAGPNSRKAIANLARLRATTTVADWPVETVDVFEHPGRALADGILLTPQLLILAEGGARAVVGDLSDRAALLAALALEPP